VTTRKPGRIKTPHFELGRSEFDLSPKKELFVFWNVDAGHFCIELEEVLLNLQDSSHSFTGSIDGLKLIVDLVKKDLPQVADAPEVAIVVSGDEYYWASWRFALEAEAGKELPEEGRRYLVFFGCAGAGDIARDNQEN
jgi:hypothetical protein